MREPRQRAVPSSDATRLDGRRSVLSRRGSESTESNEELSFDSEASIPRFHGGWYRYIPFLGYHHVLMIIGGVILILLSLVLAGCTSTGALRNLHLASIEYVLSEVPPSELMTNKTLANSLLDWINEARTGTVLSIEEVRVGYFSSCMRVSSGMWHCGLTAGDLRDVSDPLDLVGVAQAFRTKTITPGLIILCSILDLAAIGVLYTFPGWHEEEDSKGSERDVKPFPARSLSYLTLTFFFSCCGGLYIAIAWQHIAVAAAAVGVEGLRYGLVKVSVGYASIVLSWFSVFLSFVCFFGILVMILSIRVLSEMKE